MVKDANKYDLNEIVDVHMRSFQGFFLSKLGPLFLKKYYNFMLHKDRAIFLVAKEEKVQGFVCGLSHAKEFNRAFFVNQLHIVLFSSLIAAIRYPGSIMRIFSRVGDISHFKDDSNIIYLLSIAVDPKESRGGIGTLLLEKFIERAKNLGYLQVYLTTDRDLNDDVNLFYRRNKFALIGNYDSGNSRMMNEYVYYLEEKNAMESAAF
ncbi:MAG: GNAT family N-acetyltransferase [Mobilitalea sp.]